MRLIYVHVFTVWMLLMSFGAKGQEPKVNQGDTVVWYNYIGGKPDMRYVRAQAKVFKSIGVRMETFYGDCGGTFDYKHDEFEKKNVPAVEFLQSKLGNDWKVELNRLVHAEMTSSQD